MRTEQSCLTRLWGKRKDSWIAVKIVCRAKRVFDLEAQGVEEGGLEEHKELGVMLAHSERISTVESKYDCGFGALSEKPLRSIEEERQFATHAASGDAQEPSIWRERKVD